MKGRERSVSSNWRARSRPLHLWPVLPVIALGVALAAPALARSPENGVRGEITEVSRSAEVVVVEEDPSEKSGSDKGEFALDGDTEILDQRDGDPEPAAFEDLRVGQVVEATYSGPVAESYPTQGIAGRIVILEENQTDNPDGGGLSALPDTGGAPLAALCALQMVSALLVNRVTRYLR